LGDVRELSGQFDRAVDAYTKALRLQLAAEPVARAELLLRRARAHERRGELGAATRDIGTARRAVAGMTSRAALSVRTRLVTFAAVVQQAQERPVEAMATAERAVVEARAADDREALARAYVVLDWAHRVLGRADGAEYLTQALILYEELGDVAGQGMVTANLGVGAYFEGRWDEAIAWYRQAIDAFGKAGNAVQAALNEANVGELLVNQGRVVEARPLLVRAARVMRAARYRDGATFAEIQLARADAMSGEIVRAVAALERLHQELVDAGLPGTALDAATHLADCGRRLGDPGAALELLDAPGQGAVDLSLWGPAASTVRAEALVDLGRVDEAAEEVEAALAEARRQGLAYDVLRLLQVDGRVAEAAGRVQDPHRAAEADALATQLGVVAADGDWSGGQRLLPEPPGSVSV
jgi:tetratricopeptide (TPR) repeat protein